MESEKTNLVEANQTMIGDSSYSRGGQIEKRAKDIITLCNKEISRNNSLEMLAVLAQIRDCVNDISHHASFLFDCEGQLGWWLSRHTNKGDFVLELDELRYLIECEECYSAFPSVIDAIAKSFISAMWVRLKADVADFSKWVRFSDVREDDWVSAKCALARIIRKFFNAVPEDESGSICMFLDGRILIVELIVDGELEDGEEVGFDINRFESISIEAPKEIRSSWNK